MENCQEEFELRIDIEIRQPRVLGGSGLRISETVPVGAAGFMEICGILAKFDELAKSIKAKHEKAKK